MLGPMSAIEVASTSRNVSEPARSAAGSFIAIPASG